MSWVLVNWEMVGALGQVAGAILTAGAVYIALHEILGRGRSQIRVRVENVDRWLEQGHFEEYVVVRAVNVGQQPARIDEFALLLPNGKTWDSNYLSAYATVPKLPQYVLEMTDVLLAIEPSPFAADLSADDLTGKVPLRAYFQDSTGHRHWIAWSFDTKTQEVTQLRRKWYRRQS